MRVGMEASKTNQTTVATVKKSAFIIKGRIGEVPTELMLDSGLARCLVRQDIVLATSKPGVPKASDSLWPTSISG